MIFKKKLVRKTKNKYEKLNICSTKLKCIKACTKFVQFKILYKARFYKV